MIRSLYFEDGQHRTQLNVDQFKTALENPGGLLWVDFEGNPPDEDEPILRDIFGFHPLAIDDALQESHVPKLDDWGEFLYIVLHAVEVNRDNDDVTDLDTLELDVFLGENYIVTHHDQQISAIERVWKAGDRDERHLRNGPDYLLYRLADEVVASYMPVVEEIDEAVERAEDLIFARPTAYSMERILMMKRDILHLRRIIGPQREVLNKLARDDYPAVDDQARVYFRDVYDHLVRLHDITEGMRDLVGGVMDTYLSVINNRMNDIMKTLTVITTLFMPISFVASFFGMNFFQPVSPELGSWTSNPMFIFTIIVLFAAPLFMFLYMRRRKWM